LLALEPPAVDEPAGVALFPVGAAVLVGAPGAAGVPAGVVVELLEFSVAGSLLLQPMVNNTEALRVMLRAIVATGATNRMSVLLLTVPIREVSFVIGEVPFFLRAARDYCSLISGRQARISTGNFFAHHSPEVAGATRRCRKASTLKESQEQLKIAPGMVKLRWAEVVHMSALSENRSLQFYPGSGAGSFEACNALN
jgi:hypothetical protein